MNWIDQKNVGDCWLNKDKTHLATLTKKTKTELHYTWTLLDKNAYSPFDGLMCKIKIQEARIIAPKHWYELTPLEVELWS